MRSYRSIQRGFTLVEILIVVIILGILAAIVIPQFTNASTEARESSTRSQVQTIRSQIELYKLQHVDLYPTAGAVAATPAAGAWSWDKLTSQTNEAGTVTAGGPCGPYLQQIPVNSLRNQSDVQMVDTDAAFTAATAGATDGFVFSRASGKFAAFGTNNAIIAD